MRCSNQSVCCLPLRWPFCAETIRYKNFRQVRLTPDACKCQFFISGTVWKVILIPNLWDRHFSMMTSDEFTHVIAFFDHLQITSGLTLADHSRQSNCLKKFPINHFQRTPRTQLDAAANNGSSDLSRAPDSYIHHAWFHSFLISSLCNQLHENCIIYNCMLKQRHSPLLSRMEACSTFRISPYFEFRYGKWIKYSTESVFQFICWNTLGI